jgi:hypothetical protein
VRINGADRCRRPSALAPGINTPTHTLTSWRRGRWRSQAIDQIAEPAKRTLRLPLAGNSPHHCQFPPRSAAAANTILAQPLEFSLSPSISSRHGVVMRSERAPEVKASEFGCVADLFALGGLLSHWAQRLSETGAARLKSEVNRRDQTNGSQEARRDPALFQP